MNYARYAELVQDLCGVIGLPDAQQVLQGRTLEVDGFTVLLDYMDNDPEAMYLQFDFGIASAGNTLRLFRMMLESNLLVYAQDQAQLGLNPDTGGALLVLRLPMSEDMDGGWLAETLAHYVEHGRYWRDLIANASEEEFEGLAGGNYQWLRA
jgi:hypothetical protein